MKILSIIVARSGSKGIKNKNMVKINDKPLIFYSLKILKNIKKLTYPFVSTDSTKIISYCNKFGFNEGYIRPKKLSGKRHKPVEILQEKENFNSLHRVICHVLSIIRYHREPTHKGLNSSKRFTNLLFGSMLLILN